MNFKLVSILSESDRVETELEICRGAITQPSAPYLFASCCSAQTMSAREQLVLQRAWSHTPSGRLSPWMEAKAWGLREGWRDFHDGSEHGMLTWISKRVTKGGGDNPTVEAVRLLFEKISTAVYRGICTPALSQGGGAVDVQRWTAPGGAGLEP